jgi:hypothetical protein
MFSQIAFLKCFERFRLWLRIGEAAIPISSGLTLYRDILSLCTFSSLL